MLLLLLAWLVEPARTEGICGVERRSSVGQETAGGARDDQELAQPFSRASGPSLGANVGPAMSGAGKRRIASACGSRDGGASQSRPPQQSMQAGP
jgi:hypothetical protein